VLSDVYPALAYVLHSAQLSTSVVIATAVITYITKAAEDVSVMWCSC
jgi:hypothetical protein